MPVNLSQIAINEATITLTGGSLGDGSLTITFYPGRITEETVAMPQAFANTSAEAFKQNFADFNAMLVGLIKSWDLLEDDGSVFPLDAVRFGKLPIAFRMQVYQGIMENISPEAVAASTPS